MISYFVLVLQFICLSMWIGGSTVLLMVVTPHLYDPDSSDLPDLLTPIMKRFFGILSPVLVFFAVTLAFQLLVLSNAMSLKLRLALTVTSLSIFLTIYNRFAVIPRIEEFWLRIMNKEQEGPAGGDHLWYQRARGRSLVLTTLNLFLGLTVVILLILPM